MRRRRISTVRAGWRVIAVVGGLTIGITAAYIVWSRVAWNGPRHARLLTIISETQPLRTAIAHYIQDHHEPPQALESLVPVYLPVLPTLPAIADGHDWLYTVEPNGASGKKWRLGFGMSYGFCPCHPFSKTNYFVYSSIQDHPRTGANGGYVERIGNEWAYYHE